MPPDGAVAELGPRTACRISRIFVGIRGTPCALPGLVVGALGRRIAAGRFATLRDVPETSPGGAPRHPRRGSSSCLSDRHDRDLNLNDALARGLSFM